MQDSGHWCEILMLHLNVKQCRASTTPAGPALALIVGRKFDQPLADAYGFDFAYRVIASRADYLQVSLSADERPLATSD